MRTLDATDSIHPRPSADTREWTVRAAVTESRPSTLVAAALLSLATASTALHPGVPAAAVVAVIAMFPAVLVDVLARRLPNRLVGGAALVGGVAVAASVAIGLELSVLDGVVGALAMSVPLLMVHLISPASMGFGDVKAALVFGAALGLIDPVLPIVGLAAGSLGATVHGLVSRSKMIAFGPSLLGGTALVMVLAVSPSWLETDGVQVSIQAEAITSPFA